MAFKSQRVELVIRYDDFKRRPPSEWLWETMMPHMDRSNEMIEFRSERKAAHLAEYLIPGNGVQRELYVVLRDMGETSGHGRYVVHYWSRVDNSYESGSYFESNAAGLARAWGEFGERVGRNADYVERCLREGAID